MTRLATDLILAWLLSYLLSLAHLLLVNKYHGIPGVSYVGCVLVRQAPGRVGTYWALRTALWDINILGPAISLQITMQLSPTEAFGAVYQFSAAWIAHR